MHAYAWSENVGWIRFGSGVDVSDSAVTGYAWIPERGWLHLSPAHSGVHNDGAGNLSGQAWGEQVGWVDFAGVTIDADGFFHGYAEGDITGQVNFNCENTATCGASDFKVRTEWRQASAPVPVVSSGGGGVASAAVPTILPVPETSPSIPAEVLILPVPVATPAPAAEIPTAPRQVSTASVPIAVPVAQAEIPSVIFDISVAPGIAKAGNPLILSAAVLLALFSVWLIFYFINHKRAPYI